jgi:hypothetical protein
MYKKNNQKSISEPIEFTCKENYKNLQKILNQNFLNKTDLNLLYILDNQNPSEYFLREFIFLKQEHAIYSWSHGLITNFSETLKSYLPDKKNEHQNNIFNLEWNDINTIFITKLPEKKSSIIKELLLVKQALNIKIIAMVDVNNIDNLSLCKSFKHIENLNLVDIPLYFSFKKNINFIEKDILYYKILKTLENRYCT